MASGVTLGVLLRRRVPHPIRLEDPSGKYRHIHLKNDVAQALRSYIEGQRITILSIPEGVSDSEVKEALKDPSLSCFEVNGRTMRLVGGRLPAEPLPRRGRDWGAKISAMEAAFTNLEETAKRQIKIATGAQSEVTAEDFCKCLDAGEIAEAVKLLSKIVDIEGEAFDLADEKAMEQLSQGIPNHIPALAGEITENEQAVEGLSMLMACLNLEEAAENLLKSFAAMKGKEKAERAYIAAAECFIEFFLEDGQAQKFILKLARFALRKKMPEAHAYFERAKAAGVKVGKAKGQINSKELSEAEKNKRRNERVQAKTQAESAKKAEQALKKAWHDLLSANSQTASKAVAAFISAADQEALEEFLKQRIHFAVDTNPHQADDIYHALCRLEEAFGAGNSEAKGLEAFSLYEQQKIILIFSLLDKLRQGRVLAYGQVSVLGESAPQFFGEEGRYRELASDIRAELQKISQNPGHRHSELAGVLISDKIRSLVIDPADEILRVIDQIHSKCKALGEGEDVSPNDLKETAQLVANMVNLANQNPSLREEQLQKIIGCIEHAYNANPYFKDIAKKAIQDMAPIKPKARIKEYARYISYFQLLFRLAVLHFREDNIKATDIINIILQNIPGAVEIYLPDSECSERIEIRAMCCNLLATLFIQKATRLLSKNKSDEAQKLAQLAKGAAKRSLEFQRNVIALVELAKVETYFCRYEEAERAFEEAIATDPAYYRAYVISCHLHTAEGRENIDKILDVLSRLKAKIDTDFKKGRCFFDEKGLLIWIIPHLAEFYCVTQGKVIIEILDMLKGKYGAETIDAMFLGLVANGTFDPQNLVAPMPEGLLEYFSVPEEVREPFRLTSS
jgi:hypothetical protein